MLGVTSQEAAWFAAPFYGEESLNKLKQMDEDFLTFFDSILTYTLTEEVNNIIFVLVYHQLIFPENKIQKMTFL